MTSKLPPNKAAYSHLSSAERHHADDYPTPPGFLRPLLDHLDLDKETFVFEPCAGGGHIVAELRRQGFTNVSFRDLQYSGHDFLTEPLAWYPDWVITNPPYKLGEAFVRRALGVAIEGVAMLMNTAFLEGIGRSTGLFTEFPPSQVLMCNRRMKLPTGQSSTFSHVWIVWEKQHEGPTTFDWLILGKDEIQMPTGQAPGVWT